MTLPKNADVVVVGAGPTGLTLACTLRAANLDVLVLDKVAEGANTSRAAVIHARTLEVLDELDVTRRLIAEGCVVPVFTVRDRQRVLARLDFSTLPTLYPYTLMLPQWRTEAILAERLAELNGHVERPWTVTSVDTTATGAVVTAMDANGVSESVQARYVVGADGLNSVVRTSAGIGFTGDSYDASFVLADAQLDWPLAGRRGAAVLLTRGIGGRRPATRRTTPHRRHAGSGARNTGRRPGPRRARRTGTRRRTRSRSRLVLPLPSPTPTRRQLPKRLPVPGR